MRVFLVGHQPGDVDDVDDADGQRGEVLAEQGRRGQYLHGGHVAGAGEYDVRFAGAVVGAGPLPDAGATRHVGAGLVDRQPVEAGLFAGDDHIDLVAAAQGVIGHGEQGVGVRRQVDPYDLGALVEDVVDEAGVLVGEAVVVLAPDVGGEQVVEGGDRRAPGQFAGGLQPLDVLGDHGVDDVGEGLVGGEEAVAAGEEVPLQPALADVFGQDLHDPAVAGQVPVRVLRQPLPGLPRDLVQVVQPVGGGLVRPDDPEVPALGGVVHDLGEEVPEDAGRFVEGAAGLVDGDGVRVERGQRERSQQASSVRVRDRAEAALAFRDAGQDLRRRAAVGVEELLRPVRAHPVLQLPQVCGVLAHPCERDLVRPPGAFDRIAVDGRRASPALGRAQDDHRPACVLPSGVGARRPRLLLDEGDAVQGVVQRAGHGVVHLGGVAAGHVQRVVPVAAQQRVELVLGDPGQHRRVGDLVAVQVQDRQDRAVVDRVEELVRVPGRCQRARFRLAVADDTGDEQAGVVEGGSVGVGESVTELAALVDGARRFRCHMARHAARKGELPEQRAHTRSVPRDARVGLGVGALEPGVGEDGGAAVARTPDAQGVEGPLLDQAVQVGVDEVEAGGGAPVAEQPRFDVLRA